MNKELPKSYEPQQVEDKIYKFWVDNDYFKAEVDPKKEPYTIVMPPPNITGKLHMGHALDETLQDVLIRFKRMQGYNALWVPGTDHASIATEAKIVEQMRQEGVTKEEIGREEFLKRAFLWKEKYGSTIMEQIKQLGASCDWSHERFTMDDGCSKAVNEVFVNLYKKGLIYRGERIINWCPKCKTSISDAEVEFTEKDGNFYHLRYPIVGAVDQFVELATTRPETLLGDTAIAVNPNDERYQSLVGQKVLVPLVNREVPIIADNYVEQDFGTGVVKITPAHDPNDFEVGQRHNLPIINVMDEQAIMNENAGQYRGLTRYEAREKIVEDLKAQGFLVKIEPMKHNVGTCYRCSDTVEPRVSLQWFVKMDELAKPAIEAVKNGETQFIPKRFEKIYFNWLNNIKDWCISRQLWWGHRIPSFYCNDCGKMTVSKDAIEACEHCGSTHIKQDEDTLDTWFSSALWPFSVFGWPEKTKELEYFYPTATLVTGYDIIFFWVVRMMFSGLEHTGKVPFKNVFIHGLVRDAQGRKMSKSLGNGIDPIDIINSHGADALRFTLSNGISPGNDIRFSEEKVGASRNFANKIWNAARFIHMKTDDFHVDNNVPENLQIEDKWILAKLNEVISEVTNNLENFELGIASQKLYDFIWDDFCDWYIELTKLRLMSVTPESETAANTRTMLVYVLSEILKLLHPFMPFITEEIYQSFNHDFDSIMIATYPKYNSSFCFPEKQELDKVMDLIKAIRARRAELNVPQSRKTKIYIISDESIVFASCRLFIEKLACAEQVIFQKEISLANAASVVTPCAKAYIPMDELVDRAEELTRLNKELESIKKQFDLAESKLANENFLSKAPAAVVQKVRDEYSVLKEKIRNISDMIASLSK